MEKIFSIKSVAGMSRPYLSSAVGWSLYNGVVEGDGFDTLGLRIGYFWRKHSMRMMRIVPIAQSKMPLHLMGAMAVLIAFMMRLLTLSK